MERDESRCLTEEIRNDFFNSSLQFVNVCFLGRVYNYLLTGNQVALFNDVYTFYIFYMYAHFKCFTVIGFIYSLYTYYIQLSC